MRPGEGPRVEDEVIGEPERSMNGEDDGTSLGGGETEGAMLAFLSL